VAFAQRELAIGAGDNAFNAGLTLNTGLYNDKNNSYDKTRPGVTLVYDRMITDMFSAGAEFGLFQHSYRRVLTEWEHTYITPAFRFGFHPFGIPATKGNITVATVLDPYVVVGAGLRIHSWSWQAGVSRDDGTDTDFVVMARPGIRWFFTPRINFWAEGGFGLVNNLGSAITLGAGVRF
jgi:hypothetical protein